MRPFLAIKVPIEEFKIGALLFFLAWHLVTHFIIVKSKARTPCLGTPKTGLIDLIRAERELNATKSDSSA